MVKTAQQLYEQAYKSLSLKEDGEYGKFLAGNLLSHFAGISRERLLADPQTPVDADACAKVEFATSRLLEGEPLAYVLGQWEFFGMNLTVDKNVLIPRDDTCAVTELAVSQAMCLEDNPRILDLCTGSGCIGLAIAQRVPDARVTLADISRQALLIARDNAATHHLTARVSCVQVNALEDPPAFLGKMDMIVSNPPYVTTQEMEELPHSVKDYEPHLALWGGEDGLDFYRAIGKNYKQILKPGGYLCLEFGMGQGDSVCRILEENGFSVLERSEDYNHIERAVLARLNREDV